MFYDSAALNRVVSSHLVLEDIKPNICERLMRMNVLLEMFLRLKKACARANVFSRKFLMCTLLIVIIITLYIMSLQLNHALYYSYFYIACALGRNSQKLSFCHPHLQLAEPRKSL